METINNLTKERIISDITINKVYPKIELDKIKNPLTLFIKSNSVYSIKYNYDLKGNTITIPAGCTLKFEGGMFKNGTLVGNSTNIDASNEKIFDNVNIIGTWNCEGNVAWFANGNLITENNKIFVVQNQVDDTDNLQKALDSTFRELVFPPKAFYVKNTLTLTKEKKLVFKGTSMRSSLIDRLSPIINNSIIFTDLNICLLRISTKEGLMLNTVEITGGNFDVSLCNNYTLNCIEVTSYNGEQLWGVNINTTIKGRLKSPATGTGLYINPNCTTSVIGHITQININSNIANFEYGIIGRTTNDNMHGWCTSLKINSNIIDCMTAVDSNVEFTDILGFIQAGSFFNSSTANRPLIVINTDKSSISATIFDVGMGSGNTMKNKYAVSSDYPGAVIEVYGPFKAYLSQWYRTFGNYDALLHCTVNYYKFIVDDFGSFKSIYNN